jgi:hypothetical protein
MRPPDEVRLPSSRGGRADEARIEGVTWIADFRGTTGRHAGSDGPAPITFEA